MADEDEIFQDAGPKLFGKGFTKKAKECDVELKVVSGPASWRPAQSANLSPFFPRQSSHNGKHRQGFKANRGKPRFGPYHHTPASKDDSRR